ncbi:MAG: outer membrane protein transport protein [Deltaproteobacteria bacterium]|nr:outer membrane protein transport protein [Deltaproteobacteria bacterium]
MKRLVLCLVMLMVLVPLFHGTSWGVIVNQYALNFNFNFNTPGARANAMGGAFQAVADDATAAFANPAGLIVLKQPEFAAEYKYSNVTTVTYDYPDGFEREFTNSVSGMDFASFSYPIKNANITIFRHELVNSDSTWTDHQGAGTAAMSEYFSKIKIITYGVAGAYKLSNTFSLGLTVGLNELDYQMYINTPPTSPTYTTKWGGDGTAENFTASALWSPHRLFNLGVVYRYGPKFKYINTTENADIYGNTSINHFEDTFKVPDVLGVGISSRPFEGLTLSLDCNYIWYSQFMKDVKYRDGETAVTTPSFTAYASDSKMDDTYEIHVGAEYVFSFKNPLAVRAGYAYKPDHRAYWDGTRPVGSDAARRAMPHGEDEHVFSGGFGVVVGENVQIDFAYTHSNFNEDYIASFVYRF